MYYLAGQFRRLEIPYFEICLYFENLSQKYNLVVYLHWMDISFDKYCIKVSLFRNVFLVSPILPKNEHENSNFCPSLLGQKLFVRFLGELKKQKRPFEFNWPLTYFHSVREEQCFNFKTRHIVRHSTCACNSLYHLFEELN